MFQGPKGYTVCEVHLHYGNSTTKWWFYDLIPLYTFVKNAYFLIWHLKQRRLNLAAFIVYNIWLQRYEDSNIKVLGDYSVILISYNSLFILLFIRLYHADQDVQV